MARYELKSIAKVKNILKYQSGWGSFDELIALNEQEGHVEAVAGNFFL